MNKETILNHIKILEKLLEEDNTPIKQVKKTKEYPQPQEGHVTPCAAAAILLGLFVLALCLV